MNIGRLVKKMRFGESIKLDFSGSNVKHAIIHVERNEGYSEGWIKLVIEADKTINIAPVSRG